MGFTSLQKAARETIEGTTVEAARPDRATPLSSQSFTRDENFIDDARRKAAAPNSYEYAMEQDLDPKHYQKTLDQAVALGWRMGYVEGALQVNESLRKNGFAGTLSQKDEARLRREYTELQKDYNAVAFHSAESYEGNLISVQSSARLAGVAQAKLDIDATMKERGKAGFLDYYKQSELRMEVHGKLLDALDNNLVQKR